MESLRQLVYRGLLGIGLFAALTLTVSGCLIPGAVSGGGWIPSADGVSGDKANFGFSGQQCDLTQPPTGNFNFHDKTSKFSAPGSVKMNGTLVDAGQCAISSCTTNADCTQAADGTCITTGSGLFCAYPNNPLIQGCLVCVGVFGAPLPTKTYGLDVNYTSTNTAFPGTGTASVCVIDNGQGSNASEDQLAIVVESGPYGGYENSGSVQGNISAQTCP